jgi:hypothetical protein
MDTTAASLLGQQLTDFLVEQFATPSGTKDSLGFLGTGVAVEPNSFLSQGQFNPARVNSWLSIVVDPLGAVIKDGNRVESTSWTAIELMQIIATQAVCVAPAGSNEQQGFARAKSLAMENAGGATTINTAPLDWYDPAQLAQWPKCSLTTSNTRSSGTGSPLPPLEPPPSNMPPRTPLWAWRTLGKVRIPDPDRLEPVDIPAAKGTALHAISDPIRARPFLLSANMVAAASPATSARLAPVGESIGPARVMQFSHVSDATLISIDQAPAAVITEQTTTRFSSVQAVMVSQAISTAASQASTSSVTSSSLSLNLSYLVVSLSRAPWWNDLLLSLDNWYIPGMDRAALVADSDAQRILGVPIALVLTYDVKIQAMWSVTDRAAASSNTHFGPWVLNSAQFTGTTNAGEAILTIPGIQAIACIYRELPAFPPKADPSLGTGR